MKNNNYSQEKDNQKREEKNNNIEYLSNKTITDIINNLKIIYSKIIKEKEDKIYIMEKIEDKIKLKKTDVKYNCEEVIRFLYENQKTKGDILEIFKKKNNEIEMCFNKKYDSVLLLSNKRMLNSLENKLNELGIKKVSLKSFDKKEKQYEFEFYELIEKKRFLIKN